MNAMVAVPSRHRHNAFATRGPRCRQCSGLGLTLSLPVAGTGPTKYAAKCLVCHGTGIDVEALQLQRFMTVERRLLDLERQHTDLLKALNIHSLRQHSPEKCSRQYWEELVAFATNDGTAIANTTTEALIFPDTSIPANYMADGRALRITASGKLSTTATPTMTWALRYGGVSGTLLATSEAITNGSGVTNVNWRLQCEIQTRTNGATGTLIAMGELFLHTSSTAVSVNVFGVSGFDAPAAVTVDLTATTSLSLTGDWSAASASNTLTGLMYYIESLN